MPQQIKKKNTRKYFGPHCLRRKRRRHIGLRVRNYVNLSAFFAD